MSAPALSLGAHRQHVLAGVQAHIRELEAVFAVATLREADFVAEHQADALGLMRRADDAAHVDGIGLDPRPTGGLGDLNPR